MFWLCLFFSRLSNYCTHVIPILVSLSPILKRENSSSIFTSQQTLHNNESHLSGGKTRCAQTLVVIQSFLLSCSQLSNTIQDDEKNYEGSTREKHPEHGSNSWYKKHEITVKLSKQNILMTL